jgi:DNA-binding transcriptional MerR regulator
MRIGELSRRTGVDERLLRYYERQGLLHPARDPNGYRVYEAADTGLVLRIRALLAAGLSTAVIAEIQPCIRGAADPTPACAGVAARLQEERDRIDDVIDDLRTARDTLEAIITSVPAPGRPVPQRSL